MMIIPMPGWVLVKREGAGYRPFSSLQKTGVPPLETGDLVIIDHSRAIPVGDDGVYVVRVEDVGAILRCLLVEVPAPVTDAYTQAAW